MGNQVSQDAGVAEHSQERSAMTPYEQANAAYKAAFANLQAAREAYHRTRTIGDAEFIAVYNAWRDAEAVLSAVERDTLNR
jgi:hypothetical protein